jgi:hypothetical protein
VAGTQRRGERAVVAECARPLDGGGAELLALPMVGRVGELDREPCLQARAQRGGARIERREGLVERLDALLVDAQDRHARPGRAERGPREQLGVAARPSAGRRRLERRAGLVGALGGRERLAEPAAQLVGEDALAGGGRPLQCALEHLRRRGGRRREQRGAGARRQVDRLRGRKRGRPGERVPSGGDERGLVARVRPPGERRGRAGVQPSAVARPDPVEQRVLHQRVGERGGAGLAAWGRAGPGACGGAGLVACGGPGPGPGACGRAAPAAGGRAAPAACGGADAVHQSRMLRCVQRVQGRE